MINSLTKAVNIAHDQANRIVTIEAQLQDIYRKFPFISSQEQKEQEYKKFFDLLNEREECEVKVDEIITIMQTNIGNLNKIKNSIFDKIVYKLRIRELGKMLESQNSLVENVVEEVHNQKTEADESVKDEKGEEIALCAKKFKK
ncbi:MAG TPA: hypothetical protein VFK73_05845 [Paludibacter sp.]|nr:hypothetical protein [Paludibacter sp.]